MNGLQVSQRIGRSLYIYKIWSSSSLAVSFLGFASFFPEVVTDCLSLVLQALQTVGFFGSFSLTVRPGLWLSLRLKALKTGNTPFVILFLHVSVCFQYLLTLVFCPSFQGGSSGCYSAIRLDIGVSLSALGSVSFNCLLSCGRCFYLQHLLVITLINPV